MTSNAPPPSLATRLLGRLYQTLLLSYPAKFRRTYGAEMHTEAQLTMRQAHDARGLLGLWGAWSRLVADLIRTAPRERWRQVSHRLSRTWNPSTATAGSPMREWIQDLSFGWRSLRKAPAFAAVAVLTLALGIGVSVAAFGTMYTTLFRPLPFHEPDRLVMGQATFDGNLNPWASGADYVDYRNQADLLQDLAAIMPFRQGYTITGGGQPERVTGTTISINLFRTLGVRPVIGREFSTDEGEAGGPDVVIVSTEYWNRRFAGLQDAIGQTVTIDGTPATVVGVMPAGFSILPDVEFWQPMRPDRDRADSRGAHNWLLIGRLRADVTLSQAQRQVDVISAQLKDAYPETNEHKGLLLANLHEVLIQDYRTRIVVLTAAIALVLVLASVNVAGMMLARAPAQRLQLSVRAALGATRGRLVRQAVAETALIVGGAGAVGTLLAVAVQRQLPGLLRLNLPGVDTSLSWPMLAFALALSTVAGLLAGVYPAVTSVRGNLTEALKAGSRAVSNAGMPFRSGLVVVQVALSLVLLIGSGLLVASFARVNSIDPGFDATNVMTAEVSLPSPRYEDAERRRQFYGQLRERLSTVPGVSSVGLVSHLPIRDLGNRFGVASGENPEDSEGSYLRMVLPGYFETMHIPILSGRGIDQQDVAEAPRVFVINETAVRTFFPDQNPIGRQVVLNWFGTPRAGEVVGVVGDVRMSGLEDSPGVAVYGSYQQTSYSTMRLAIRSELPLTTMTPLLRDAVAGLDPDIPLVDLAALDDLVSSSVSERRAVALATIIFGALPLILAAVGLYAVMASFVGQRLREIGIRMALGANSGRVGWLILRRGIVLLASGMVLGVVGAVAATRFIRHLLFGVEPTDPGTFVLVSVFVASTTILACVVPTRRAMRVDPQRVLQAE